MRYNLKHGSVFPWPALSDVAGNYLEERVTDPSISAEENTMDFVIFILCAFRGVGRKGSS